jgi:hypothetical protein
LFVMLVLQTKVRKHEARQGWEIDRSVYVNTLGASARDKEWRGTEIAARYKVRASI